MTGEAALRASRTISSSWRALVRISLTILLLFDQQISILAFIRHSKAHQTFRQQPPELRGTADLPPELQEIFKRRMLATLGLDSAPTPKQGPRQPLHVPNYLWDLYHSFSDANSKETSSSGSRVRTDAESSSSARLPIPASRTSVVRTFLPAPSGIEFLPASEHGGRVKLTFNLTHGFPADERMTNSFVRLRVNRSESDLHRKIRLNFYQVTNLDHGYSLPIDAKVLIPPSYPELLNNSSSAIDGESKDSLPNKTVESPKLIKDWVAFDVTSQVARYTRRSPETVSVVQFEIGVSVSHLGAEPDSWTDRDINTALAELFGIGSSGGPDSEEVLDNQPVLLWYGQDSSMADSATEWSPPAEADGSVHQDDSDDDEYSSDEDFSPNHHSRYKRKAASRQRSRRGGRSRSGRRRGSGRRGHRKLRRRPVLAANKRPCHRVRFYIDFSELGWNNWIIAPSGYQAYLCTGVCEYPMHDRMNATNNSIIRSLIHGMDNSVPPPCCVPTETSFISILYQDPYDRTVVKNYPDMAVEGCGCR